VRLDEVLHIRLGLSKTRNDLRHAAIRRVEQLQSRHLRLLRSKIENTGEGRNYFRDHLRARENGVRGYVRTAKAR